VNEVLAWYRYPEPKGMNYFESDLMKSEKAIEVFDYCQILLAYISKAGWDFLIKHYGYEELYKLDKISGWFDSPTIDEFIEDIQSIYGDSVPHIGNTL
jgi:hypothetical protein